MLNKELIAQANAIKIGLEAYNRKKMISQAYLIKIGLEAYNSYTLPGSSISRWHKIEESALFG